MSHVSIQDRISIADLDAYADANAECGLTFYPGQQTFRWFQQFVGDAGRDAARRAGLDPATFGHCEHASGIAGNPRAYEVGLVRVAGKPGYVLAYDDWAGGHGLMERIGPGACRLLQAYADAAIFRQAARTRGLTVIGRATLPDGTRTIQVRDDRPAIAATMGAHR